MQGHSGGENLEGTLAVSGCDVTVTLSSIRGVSGRILVNSKHWFTTSFLQPPP